MNENGSAVTTSFSANAIVTNWLEIMMRQDGLGKSEFIRALIVNEWKRRNPEQYAAPAPTLPQHSTTDREA